MSKSNKKWLNVTNKYTYLLLLTVPLALVKIFMYDIHLEGIANIVTQVFLSIIVGYLGVHFFVKLNTYSNWMNPNHPKP